MAAVRFSAAGEVLYAAQLRRVLQLAGIRCTDASKTEE